MSMTLTLVPVVIALGSTLSTASLAALCRGRGKTISDVPTLFTDRELLIKTLNENGLDVNEKDEDHIIVNTPEGELHYERKCKGEQYMLSARNVRNMKHLAGSLKEFEAEYGRNVQTYTYNRILRSLEEHGLTLNNEEVLEDDSIILTLTV